MKPSEHPSPVELEAFGLGQLQAEASARIEAHVTQCDLCCKTLRQVQDDTLVELARAAHQASPTHAAIAGAVTAQNIIPPELTDHPRYRIKSPLGSGGMGVVLEAEHRVMERRVALKIIHHSLVSHPQAVDRFRREMKTAARLNHPNIVQAYDADQAGDLHFLAMEMVDGVNLAHLVGERGALPITEACNLAMQAAKGLEYAHGLGMVHRDIKPHNLMVTPHSQLKILDFGLARFTQQSLGGDSGMTGRNTMVGTPDYMSPEQANNSAAVDARSDLYSLGCTLYFLLTGRPPFKSGTVMEKLIKHCTEPPPPIASLRPDVPPSLATLIDRLLAKKPDERIQTASELVQALAPFVRNDAPVSLPSNRVSVSRRKWWLALIPVAFIAAVLGWWMLRPTGPRVLFVLPSKMLHLPDYQPVRAELEKAGARVETASIGRETCQLDEHSEGLPVATDRALDASLSMKQFDMVIFVGGMGAEELTHDDIPGKIVARLIQEGLFEPGKRVGGICMGQAPLFKHGGLKNRKAAFSRYLTEWLEKRKEPVPPTGVDVVSEPVVVDRQLVTAGLPEHAILFAQELLKSWKR